MVSDYLEGNNDIKPYLLRIKLACDKLNTGHLMVVGDVNAWSHWWGSSLEDGRGVAYHSFLDEMGLEILNIGTTPTFEVFRGERLYTSCIDVTACSGSLLERLEG